MNRMQLSQAIFQPNLEREREDERVIMQLTNEFKKIDYNGDGEITSNEIVDFLRQLSRGQIDTSIAEEIF